MTKEKEIREVIEAEKRRGSRRRPRDAKALAERKQVREELRAFINAGDETGFVSYLIESGLTKESPAFQRNLKIFRDALRQRG